jgi:N-acetylglucosamine-6-phosphate deacetylase
MLGLQGIKGTLDADADADLIILSDHTFDGSTQLVLEEVWKFGTRVSRPSKMTT